MKTKRNPEPDVAKILDIDHFFNPRKRLKRWLAVAFLVTAMLFTVAIWIMSFTGAIWIKMKISSPAQYKTEQSVKRISPIKLK